MMYYLVKCCLLVRAHLTYPILHCFRLLLLCFVFQLCTKDRDLVAGSTFEHEVIMQVIRDRCRRLIVIVSPPFLESAANKFFLTFAQALGIGKIFYPYCAAHHSVKYFSLMDGPSILNKPSSGFGFSVPSGHYPDFFSLA